MLSKYAAGSQVGRWRRQTARLATHQTTPPCHQAPPGCHPSHPSSSRQRTLGGVV